MTIAISGANGFVGRHTVAALAGAGHRVRALVRNPGRDKALFGPDVDVAGIADLQGGTDPGTLAPALAGCDAVIHLAAKVHVMRPTPADTAAFDSVNVGGSTVLMQAAAAAGVRRFVFVSSVKAAGERSGAKPLSAAAEPNPEDDYGRSKLAAEIRLAGLARDLGVELIIVRPTLVYGWPASGNFRRVIGAVRRGLVLPLASIANRRDMLYVGNLADALRVAATSTAPGKEPYFIADGAPVSTPELFRSTAAAFGKPSRLLPIPVGFLRAIAAMTGQTAVIQRLTENLEVDGEPFRRDFGWNPPFRMADGLAHIAAEARAEQDGTATT